MSEIRIPKNYDNENIRPYFERELFFDRQRYPKSAEDSHAVVDELAELAAAGKHIAIVDGSFDVPHPNHQWYLMHCRMLAARNYSRLQGEYSEDPDVLAANSDVFLVVTLDTDERISQIKRGKVSDADVNRPVYPWHVRAQYISNFMTPVGGGYFRPIVDMVTVDGLNEPSPNESHLMFGRALLERDALGTWIFYGEHDGNKIEAEKVVAAQPDSSAHIAGIMNNINYTVDEQGNPWTSSSIIKKIIGS